MSQQTLITTGLPHQQASFSLSCQLHSLLTAVDITLKNINKEASTMLSSPSYNNPTVVVERQNNEEWLFLKSTYAGLSADPHILVSYWKAQLASFAPLLSDGVG